MWLDAEFTPGLVSVIIPTRDRAGLLGETLASVLAQTHDQIEAVVADDGSTDETPRVLEAFRERFSKERGWQLTVVSCRLSVVGGIENRPLSVTPKTLAAVAADNQKPTTGRGGSAARNLGVKASRGEFLNFLDDDDLLSKEKIARQVKLARETGADIVYGPWVPFVKYADGCGLARPHCSRPIAGDGDGDALEAWLGGRSWKVMAALIARRFAAAADPWDENIRQGNDLAYIAGLLSRAPRMSFCPLGALYRREHERTLSREPGAAHEESLLRLAAVVEKAVAGASENRQPKTGNLDKALAQYLGRHAASCFMKGAPKAGAHFAARALAHDPGYYPRNAGASSLLAYRLGGWRLWTWKNRLRGALKLALGRLRRGRHGYSRLPELPS